MIENQEVGCMNEIILLTLRPKKQSLARKSCSLHCAKNKTE